MQNFDLKGPQSGSGTATIYEGLPPGDRGHLTHWLEEWGYTWFEVAYRIQLDYEYAGKQKQSSLNLKFARYVSTVGWAGLHRLAQLTQPASPLQEESENNLELTKSIRAQTWVSTEKVPWRQE